MTLRPPFPARSASFQDRLQRHIAQADAAPRLELGHPSPRPSLTATLQAAWREQVGHRQNRLAASLGPRAAAPGASAPAAPSAAPASAGALGPADVKVLAEAFSRLSTLASRGGAAPGAPSLLAGRAASVAEAAERLARALEPLEPRGQGQDSGHAAAHGHGHDGGGGLAIDLDEAVHGVYAAIGYLVQALKGKGADVAQEFRANADLLQRSPLAWVKDTGLAHGVAEFGVGVGVSGLLLPLSGMALKAGVEEMREAWSTHAELGDAIEAVRADADRLAGAASALPGRGGVISALQALGQTRLADLDAARRRNAEGGAVGAFSFSSGAAILGKVGIDLGTRSAHLADGANAATAVAAGAAGIAGTFALGPLAAASALGLGGYMVHKSRRKRDAFHADRVATERRLADIGTGGAQADEVRHYIDVLALKLAQHDAFNASFARWNQGFLAGSAVYGGSVAAKVALVAGVAAAGAAAVHPAGLAVLIATGAVGGLVMGTSSQQFITGHGRQARYDGYFHEDDPELDRHFLASSDFLCRAVPDADPRLGLALRAGFLGQIGAREDQRQDFLQHVAGQLGKRFDGWISHTGDPTSVREKHGEPPTRRELLAAALRRRGERTRARVSALGALPHGRRAARQAWNDGHRHLTRVGLGQWLAEPSSRGRQLEIMAATIEPLRAFQADKLAAKLRLQAHLRETAANTGDAPPDVSPAAVRDRAAVHAEQARGRELAGLLVTLDTALEHDTARLEQLAALQELVAALQADNAPDDPPASALSVAVSAFVDLQQGRLLEDGAPTPPLADSQRAFANYLLKDAPDRYRDLRGKLIETELQATRLRDGAEAGQWAVAADGAAAASSGA